MPDLDDMIEQLRRMKAPAAVKPWYEVHASAADRKATIRIYDDIGWFGTSAKTFGDELAALDVSEIDLRLNSPGGDAWDGLAIHNALRAHPATVTVTVDGMAASAASLVAMGGDRVLMNRGSQMMVHDAWGMAIGNAADMLKTAEMLGKISDSYADVYAAKAGGDRAEWRAVMRAETWYTAQEAVDSGLADATVDDQPPTDAAARFDLTAYAFAYAGRDAAPPPAIAHPKTSAPRQTPGASSCPPAFDSAKAVGAAEAMRQIHAAATKTTHASPAGGDQKGATQVDLAKLREALGLAQDVSDDEVKASALAALAPPAAPPANPPEGNAAPVAAILGAVPGTVVLSESVWDETQKQLKSLAAFVDQTKRDQRDSFLAQAIAAGKFTPSQKDQFAKLWDSNPDGTRALIDSMTPNSAFAVEAVGYATADGDDFEREYQQMVTHLAGRRH
jgi:ATP-dependent protease ClpP protease subunit